MNNFPIFYDEDDLEEINQFIRDEWGATDDYMVSHDILSNYVHTDIKMIGGEGEKKTFVTIGVGAREMNSPRPYLNHIEYVMYASPAMSIDFEKGSGAKIACDQLHQMSKFPFMRNTWFGHGHTINVSEEFTKKFGYQFLLFAEEATVDVTNTGEVIFLKVIPVYEEERNWMASHDNGSQRFLEAYISKFESDGNIDDMALIDLPRDVIVLPDCE